jgi:predicted HNH restriction endonuclease
MVNSKLEMLEGETAIGKKAHKKGEEEKGWFYKREKVKERGRKRIKTKQNGGDKAEYEKVEEVKVSSEGQIILAKTKKKRRNWKIGFVLIAPFGFSWARVFDCGRQVKKSDPSDSRHVVDWLEELGVGE